MPLALVTGATGFLGFHLSRRLLQDGFTVRALVRPTSVTNRLREMRVEFVQADVEDPASLPRAFEGVEFAFHLAGLVTQDPRAETRLHRLHVEGMRHVLDAAECAGVRRLVVTSTVGAVGANREPVPLTEHAEWRLHGLAYPYAATKRRGEEVALARAALGLPVVVVNPSIVIGPDDFAPTPGGGVVRDVVRRRMPGFVRMGLAYVDVRDVAEGHLLAARRGEPGRRYILSTQNLMLEDLFRQVAEAAGVPAPRWQIPLSLAYGAAIGSEAFAAVTDRPPGVARKMLEVANRYSWYDATRAHEELGWTPRSFAETIADTVAWYQSQPSIAR